MTLTNPVNFGPANSQTTNMMLALASAVGYTVSVLDFGADNTGITDSTIPIQNAINSVASLNGGTVNFPIGTYKISSTITQASNVILSGYGATIQWTGSPGTMIGSPATGSLNYSGIFGLRLNDGGTASVMLGVASGFSCYYRDMQFMGNSLTNTCISLTCNTTGAPNPNGGAGGLNTIQCIFEDISQSPAGGVGVGSGNGTFILLTGNSGSQGIVTNNQFINVQSQTLNVCGVNFVQWCDSNIFTGMTRIGLNGNVNPSNGIGVILASGVGQGGVYSEFFDQLAIDTFGTPATDNRQGVVCTNLLSTKNIHMLVIEMGPQREANVLNFAAGAMLSGVINIAPRTSSNYQNTNLVGTNLSVGNINPNITNASTFSAMGAWISAAQQYNYFAQSAAYNQGSPNLGVCYAASPSAAQSAGPYTVAQIMGFNALTGANGANATVTNAYGFYCNDQTIGATGNYGFYTNMTAGAGKFGFYAASTAVNLLTGPTSIGGTITNDNAAAGFVGEFVQSVVGSGSAVALSTGVSSNVTSISLSAGDWDVTGTVAFLPAATTTITILEASIGTVSATIGSFASAAAQQVYASFAPGNNAISLLPPRQRISLSNTTTVFLVAQSAFATSTNAAYGSISARRVR